MWYLSTVTHIHFFVCHKKFLLSSAECDSSVSKLFLFYGIGIENFWYRKKYRYRFRKKLVIELSERQLTRLGDNCIKLGEWQPGNQLDSTEVVLLTFLLTSSLTHFAISFPCSSTRDFWAINSRKEWKGSFHQQQHVYYSLTFLEYCIMHIV